MSVLCNQKATSLEFKECSQTLLLNPKISFPKRVLQAAFLPSLGVSLASQGFSDFNWSDENRQNCGRWWSTSRCSKISRKRSAIESLRIPRNRFIYVPGWQALTLKSLKERHSEILCCSRNEKGPKKRFLQLGLSLAAFVSALSISQANVSAAPIILDPANVLPPAQERRLTDSLQSLADETQYKVRLITRYEDDSGFSPRRLWDLDESGLVVIVDVRNSNVFDFLIGQNVRRKLPQRFFNELKSRYGNQFFVRDEGEGVAVDKAMEAITTCLRRPEGCAIVPGLSKDLWIYTVVTSAIGGLFAGLAANNGSRSSSKEPGFSLEWTLIYSPLWGILFGAFGLEPILRRTTDLVPVAANTAMFLAAAVAAFLSVPYIFTRTPEQESDLDSR